ncbi:hypothetical protein CMALT394_40029 [Carnobacterium maltaromaticum]|nr:hypothetical protein CMALT394_40029 [Carnobacterium maltaromaticum]
MYLLFSVILLYDLVEKLRCYLFMLFMNVKRSFILFNNRLIPIKLRK